MLLRPVHRDRAATHQHEHRGLADRHDTLEQPLLRGRKVDPRAIAAPESLNFDRHLLAFEPGREAETEHDHLGLLGNAHGLSFEGLGRRSQVRAAGIEDAGIA